MSYILKTINGQGYVLSQNISDFEDHDPIFFQTTTTYRNGEKMCLKIEYHDYIFFSNDTPERKEPSSGVATIFKAGQYGNWDWARKCYFWNLYKVIAEIPSEVSFKEDALIEESDLETFLRPYSPLVEKLIDIFSKYGEMWKDDCKDIHIDDFNPIEAAKDIESRLRSGKLEVYDKSLLPDVQIKEAFNYAPLA